MTEDEQRQIELDQIKRVRDQLLKSGDLPQDLNFTDEQLASRDLSWLKGLHKDLVAHYKECRRRATAPGGAKKSEDNNGQHANQTPPPRNAMEEAIDELQRWLANHGIFEPDNENLTLEELRAEYQTPEAQERYRDQLASKKQEVETAATQTNDRGATHSPTATRTSPNSERRSTSNRSRSRHTSQEQETEAVADQNNRLADLADDLEELCRAHGIRREKPGGSLLDALDKRLNELRKRKGADGAHSQKDHLIEEILTYQKRLKEQNPNSRLNKEYSKDVLDRSKVTENKLRKYRDRLIAELVTPAPKSTAENPNPKPSTPDKGPPVTPIGLGFWSLFGRVLASGVVLLLAAMAIYYVSQWDWSKVTNPSPSQPTTSTAGPPASGPRRPRVQVPIIKFNPQTKLFDITEPK